MSEKTDELCVKCPQPYISKSRLNMFFPQGVVFPYTSSTAAFSQVRTVRKFMYISKSDVHFEAPKPSQKISIESKKLLKLN